MTTHFDRPVSERESERLDSWKEIASHLRRHVTTVRRWEKDEALPVHRHVHNKLGSVYAFRGELDAWWADRRGKLESDIEVAGAVTSAKADHGTQPVVFPAWVRIFPARRWALVAATLAVCSIVAAAAGVLASRADSGEPKITAIAVLPLDNPSGDPAQEDLADAVTEGLIGQLAQIRPLKVISRTSVMTFKGDRRPVSQIAQALGVDAIVQGSIARSGDRLRVAVRVVDGRTDAHLWSRDFEHESKDVLKLQAALAQAVGDAIRVQVTSEERIRIGSAGSVEPAAYQEYVVGRYHLWRDTDENLRQAISHFERATRIDPGYTAAYASLAHAWWKRGLWAGLLEETELPARIAAQRALALDGDLPDAYVVLSDLERLYAKDLGAAEKLIKRALALNPHHVDANYTYALLLMALGRFPEAVTRMETAERVDPLSPAIQSDYGRVLYRARRFDEAIVKMNRALELEPAMAPLVHSRLADVYQARGQSDRAIASLQRAASASGSPARTLHVARALALAGNTGEARRLLKEIESRPLALQRNTLAAAYVALGDRDAAFRVLFRDLDRTGPGPNFAPVDPLFDSLRSDPRWKVFLRRISHPGEATL